MISEDDRSGSLIFFVVWIVLEMKYFDREKLLLLNRSG